MAQLAIKGHVTRGSEVIALLKMLGGTNKMFLDGNSQCTPYFIIENVISCGFKEISYYLNNDFKIFTLEEFLEKYPFKVGDFVSIPEYESEVRICEMQWDGFEIQYKVYRVDEEEWYTNDELMDYNNNPNKMIKDMDEKDKAKATPEISTLNMSAIDYNNGLVGYEIPVGYEFDTVIDNKVVLKKLKLTYPTTYEDCCKVLGISYRAQLSYTNPDVERGNIYLTKEKYLLDAFMKLRICRDAYWKIAGEQMELDKSWEPDWNHNTEKYVIYPYQYLYSIDKENYRNTVLAFPTEEMRDAFYENFKDLIEECKELL